MIEITFTHIVYLLFVIGIIASIILKKDSSLIVIFGLFIISLMTRGTFIGGLQGVYQAIFQAAKFMLGIPVLVGIVYALSLLMKETGSDHLMVAPLKRILGRPKISYWVLGITMFVLTLFFRPMPAVALIGAILVPVALSAGMTGFAAGVPLVMFGHGAGLAGDWVVQVIPQLLSNTANIPLTDILMYSGYIVGGSLMAASIFGFFYLNKTKQMVQTDKSLIPEFSEVHKELGKTAQFGAVVVPIILGAVVATMIIGKIIGGDATALLAGSILLLLSILSILEYKKDAFDKWIDYLKDGFVFAFKIFTPVFVISAFFLIGSPVGAKWVFGEGATGYMVELGQWVANATGGVNKPVLVIVQSFVALMTGLDGLGMDQIPLIGSLANALAPAVGANPAPLAVLGVMIAVWTAGALVPWGFLAALAAFCKVPPIELARRNFWPTMVAFATGIIITLFLL